MVFFLSSSQLSWCLCAGSRRCRKRTYYHHMTPGKLRKLIEPSPSEYGGESKCTDLIVQENLNIFVSTREKRKNITTTVMVCGGTGCRASRSLALVDAVREELSKQGLDKTVRLCATGCHGFCEQGPLWLLSRAIFSIAMFSPQDAFEVIYQTVMHGKLVERCFM